MSKFYPDFEDLFDQYVPMALKFQEEFQKNLQQAFDTSQSMAKASTWQFSAKQPDGEQGQAESFPGGVNPVTLDAIAPFFSSTYSAVQHALSKIPLDALGHLQTQYAAELSELTNTALSTLQNDEQAGSTVTLHQWIDGDRRFAAKDWRDGGPFEWAAALYSLNSRYSHKLVQLLPQDMPERKQAEYAIEHVISAMSPSNYLATNPEAQKKILETNGESISLSITNFLTDLTKGKISQADESAFEVGVNVATTPGDVVFENNLFQLIQYRPSTDTVGERPMLFIPPCINKYYILDLQQSNSLVSYLVSQGHTLFLVSWKNPKKENEHTTWDDYVEQGIITAMNAVCAITRKKSINVMGFCVGGTMLATALSIMAKKGENKVNSLTFLTTLLDFKEPGALSVFVSDEQVASREESIGKGGLMPGKDLAGAFSSLRPKDLIWNYVVNNYLKGEKPPAFDLLFWNSDSTNLAGPMFCWYLRNTYLENNLVEPGLTKVCNQPIDLKDIEVPTYVFAAKEDHIVPWMGGYESSRVLGVSKDNLRFVLGASGHIAGVVNPVSKNKRNFWVTDSYDPAESAQEWFDKAQSVPGSWWADWANWLEPHKGKSVEPPAKAGNSKHPVIEAAPGRYVKEKV